jgi:hypothetical protein
MKSRGAPALEELVSQVRGLSGFVLSESAAVQAAGSLADFVSLLVWIDDESKDRGGENESDKSGYADWACTHNSLLILTFDEDDGQENNRITTIFMGPSVKPGRYNQPIDHLRVLRTIEAMYGLPALARSAASQPIASVWTSKQGELVTKAEIPVAQPTVGCPIAPSARERPINNNP